MKKAAVKLESTCEERMTAVKAETEKVRARAKELETELKKVQQEIDEHSKSLRIYFFNRYPGE